MSLDGYVAPRPGNYRVTGEAARERVYDLRAEHDAVMVGAGTVRVDDPLLTIRPHRTRVKPYARVVVCETAPVPLDSKVFAAAGRRAARQLTGPRSCSRRPGCARAFARARTA